MSFPPCFKKILGQLDKCAYFCCFENHTIQIMPKIFVGKHFFYCRENKKNAKKAQLRNTSLQLKFRDAFGNILIIKRLLISLLGFATYGRYNLINSTKITNAHYLIDLPTTNVLFVSNHQTYFSDVIAMYHVFCSTKWHFKTINFPIYLLAPRVNMYYIAAEETMKEGGILPKVFSYTGAVTVKRSWRYKGQNIQRTVDQEAPEKIKKALGSGWVVTFPQGTTTPQAPVRRGTAHLIKSFNPIVIPVTIDGFNRAFDKKGLAYRKIGVQLSIKFDTPIQFEAATSIETIQDFLEKHLLT